MIGKLTGIVDSVADDTVILDVNGVGYLMQCPASTLSRLTVGAHASLMIETKVSADAIKLFGFISAEEREWFRLLQTVQNVGGKVALAVLSTLSPRDLQRALALGDKAMIGRAPGVGPKLALRIATELKDKTASLVSGGVMRRGEEDGMAAAMAHASRGPESDAVSALVHLGYSDVRAAEAVARAAQTLDEHSEAGSLIREALRSLGSGGLAR
jgi:Holliday junction DNA helicase RuvA